MKVGDLVIVNVLTKAGLGPFARVQGIVVSKRTIPIDEREARLKNHCWWFIMRSDTGTVEKFHADWIKAGENESW